MADGSAVLYEDARERVSVHRLNAGEVLRDPLTGGGELLVLSGAIEEGPDRLQTGGWMRLPETATLEARAGADGATIWMKTGHLPFAQAPAV